MEIPHVFPLSEEEILISDHLAIFWTEQMQKFFAVLPAYKPNPMIALRAASHLFANAITDFFKDFPQAQQAGLGEVQIIMRRILGWQRLGGRAA